MPYVSEYPSSQYQGKPIVSIRENDNADDVIELAQRIGAIYEDEPDSFCYVVEFPGRPPELYTEQALTRSLTKEAWHRRNNKAKHSGGCWPENNKKNTEQ